MKCAACGADNKAGRRFCGQCGVSLQRLCASCGAANEDGERFCGDCGSPLDGAAARTAGAGLNGGSSLSSGVSEPAASAERRHVTVLFADLVGFTTLSEQRDAEDVRELLSRYFATARTIIARYGGTVEKFIGDAVMAVWGVPSVQENDAERAVRAGLELVDAVAAFGEEVGAPSLRARAGVLTGEAAVSVGVTGEGMVAGDLVNSASRVQSVAEPGAVYVGDATRQSSEAAIVYEDAGSFELRGKPEPVRLWRALRVVANRGGSMRPKGLEPPFVGRERELRLLKEFLHATNEEATSRLLSIVGVGGVGKSRLAWEFEKYVDGLTEQIWWHRGRCLAYGEGVAYWALGEMVRMRAGIVENESTEAAKQKLRSTVEEFVLDAEERRWIEPRLGHLIGLEEGTASDPRDLYAAWRFFFEKMAVKQLTVLVFEDLQWADGGLLDFIEYLLEWSRNSRILIITLSRPEITDRRAGWGSGRRGLTSLYLEPLSAEAMERLLEGMAPGLPADLNERIRERAAGIPLYAVETVRMLLDRGLLAEQGGAYRVQGSLESLEVPESLHALIAARLDSLSSTERQLLQDAAVIGKSFTERALSAITTVPSGDVESALSALVSKDLLTIQSDPRSPERGQYVFVQDLVRSVAYGTLARRDRKLRHLATAAYLESAWSEEEEVAEVVAAHLVEAHAADPDAADAVDIRNRARVALVQAGEHAASLAAAESAQRYYEQALLLADDTSAAELHSRAGDMAWMQGHVESARTHFEQAEELFEAQGKLHAAARSLASAASTLGGEGRMAEAIEAGERALGMLSEVPADSPGLAADRAKTLARLGRSLYFLGELDRGMERTEQALQFAESEGFAEVFTIALDTKACILAALGRRDEAEVLSSAALKSALDNNLPLVASATYGNVGATLEEKDRIEEALSHYEEGERLARRLGDRRRVVETTLTRIPDLLELGRWDECVSVYSHYLEVDAADIQGYLAGPGGSGNMIWLYVWRGEIERARALIAEIRPVLEGAHTEMRGDFLAASAVLANAEGRASDALAAAETSLRTCLERSFPIPARRALIQAVDAAFALNRDAKVRELIDLVRSHYREGRQPGVDAHILRWRGRLAESEGDEAEVVRNFERAIEAFNSLHRPFWLAVTRLEFGEWLAARGRPAEATEQLTEARTTFEALRAAPWIDRVDNAAARPLMAEHARPAV
jgi:class 3 adenylate cyclase/tetratricopeptide (TPR) repeat protein